MHSKLSKVAASLAGIALLASSVAAFSSTDISPDNSKSIIKIAKANEATQDNPKAKKRKGGASK